MSYSDDFASIDAAGAPLDPTIMIGAPAVSTLAKSSP